MKFTIKHLSIGLLLLSIISCDEKKPKSESTIKKEIEKSDSLEFLVGTYTNETSEGIYNLSLNLTDGSLENKGLVAEISNPSYLTISNDNQYVYSICEGSSGEVTALKWNDERTKLNFVNKVVSQGSGPCYVEINTKENLLAVAHYGSGSTSVFEINNGVIKDSAQICQNVAKEGQKSPHAHCGKFDKNGEYMYVVDLGLDEVSSYSIDADGMLGEKQIALALDKGDGPRHLIFHPTKDIAFIINELSNSVVSVKIDKKTGAFEKIDKQSTIPNDYTEKTYCADIQISTNGKFLYASNRGHNSIAVFSVSEDGKLELLQTESVQGDWPRNFTLSPEGKFLLVANQKSDNIAVLNIDQNTGLLSFTGNEIKISKPVCLKF